MDSVQRMKGDRAALYLGLAGVVLFMHDYWWKVWLPRHGFEEHVHQQDATWRVCAGISVILALAWLVGSVVGVGLAYQVRRFFSIRWAAALATATVLIFIVSFPLATVWPLWTVSRSFWTALVWLPYLSTVAVIAFAAYWLRERNRR